MTQLLNLDNVTDRFQVVQELLALKRSNSTLCDNTDPNQALVFAVSIVDAFLEKEVAKLMGIGVVATDTPSLTAKEIDILKKMAANFDKPIVYRATEPVITEPKNIEQPIAASPVQTDQTSVNPPSPTGEAAPKPMRVVRRGPNSLRTLSNAQMEAATHTDSALAGQLIQKSFTSLGAGASSGQGSAE